LESIKKNEFFISRSFQLWLIIYLSIFLLLLSSKLVIFFYLAYVLSGLIFMLKKNKVSRVTVMSLFSLIFLAFILILAVPNPVSKRFYEIVKGDIKIITQDKFKPGDYFNGLQFRLLQWKFVPEILTENKRWWIGVSPGDAQSYLNAKYLSKNMYSGDPAKGTRGYLIYNTHNQFLQTTLQNGVVGLLILIAICFCLVKMALKLKSRLAIFIALVLLAWLFTESAFETQYGIIIFTFFPMFLTAADILKRSNEKPIQKLTTLKTASALF
jgi:O-antigen ligase